MNSTINDAIRTMTVLELLYHDYSLTVEPNAYGRDNAGEEILRCYQVAGGSQSGGRVGLMAGSGLPFTLFDPKMANGRPDPKGKGVANAARTVHRDGPYPARGTCTGLPPSTH